MLLTCVGVDEFLQNFVLKKPPIWKRKWKNKKKRPTSKEKKGLKGKTYPHVVVDHDKTHHSLGYDSHFHFLINDNLQN